MSENMPTVTESNTKTDSYTYGVEFLFNDNGTECAGTENLPWEQVYSFAVSDLVSLGEIDEDTAAMLVNDIIDELREDEKVMSVKINVPSSKATFEITRKLF